MKPSARRFRGEAEAAGHEITRSRICSTKLIDGDASTLTTYSEAQGVAGFRAARCAGLRRLAADTLETANQRDAPDRRILRCSACWPSDSSSHRAVQLDVFRRHLKKIENAEAQTRAIVDSTRDGSSRSMQRVRSIR